ncbi:MAG: hypothetical protein HGA45_19155 [Chloroflexales bacterium]|nr:hypothetical protein [Chloroflexales bacterium]
MTILRLFRDGSRIEFGKGHLDRCSVYLARPNQAKVPAHEAESLVRLERLAHASSPQGLYNDFIVIYNRATHEPQPYVFDLIHAIARVYGEHSFEVEVALALLYAEMVAIERRHRSRPGVKRHRRLGVHQVLVEGYSAQAAVAFSKGKATEHVVAACAARGF